MNKVKRTFGLIGYPLLQSFSPRYFEEKFRREGLKDCEYKCFPLSDIREFNSLVLNNPDLTGLNVTIPHKIAVMPLLTEVDPLAGVIGAVNTVCIRRKGASFTTKGYNTDVTGFRESLLPLVRPGHTQALIAGTGGAAMAVAHVLRGLGLAVTFISRNAGKPGMLAYEEINAQIVERHTLFINTTPPGAESLPELIVRLEAGIDLSRHLFYDLNYLEDQSPLLCWAAKHGAAVKNGLEMLHRQAEASWELWNLR